MHQDGAAWRRRSGDDQRRDSTVEVAFANTNFPIPQGLTVLWGPGGVPGEFADVCGFIEPPGPRLSRMHGAFEINHEIL